jgi:deoxycytidine triphosphate deaminase/soluble cytochrome b562
MDMSSLVTGVRLRHAIEGSTFIQNGDASSVEDVKIDLQMGSRILKASYGQPINTEELPAAERSGLAVEPGEVVFVLTKEIIHLPSTMMAVLSQKRTLAHSGIIVLGGFALDPNYFGHLWFGLYNISSTSFPIRAGRKVIAAMFYELAEGEAVEPPVVPPKCVVDFPDELILLVKNYKPVAPRALQEAIEEAQRQIASLRHEINSDSDWKTTFREGLDKLMAGLEKEKELRGQGDQRISDKIDTLRNIFAGVRVAWLLLAFAVGIIATMFGSNFFPSVLGHLWHQ